jgi:hypothetical protein
MVLLRAAFLEFLVCAHFIGAAVLFRRLFPRESPWLCFLLPVLIVLSTLNFIEHYVALSDLGWLLPLTLGGSLWILLKPGFSWEGMRFPTILFVALFTFMFTLRCISPEITNTNEGVSNLTRILNYSLGGTLPQVDCFLPPYDYGIYYSFQHYGAAILERLFNTDLGSAYNVGYTILLTWLCLTAAGVAHSISGKMWVALASMLVVMSSWTGSCPFLIFLHPWYGGDYDLSTNLNRDWGNPDGGPFSRFYIHGAIPPPALLLQPPLINLYWGEFHSTLGGNFATVAAMLAVCEVFKAQRTNWSWIALFAMPLVSIVTSSWFFFTVALICSGSFIVALIAGRRPQSWKFTCIGCILAAVLLWPFIYTITGIGTPVKFSWTLPEEHTPLWMFLIQWWPVFLPWLLLCCVWTRVDAMARWMLIALPVLFLLAEYVTIGDRKLTTEKLWASIYTFGLVTLVPMVLARKGLLFRVMGAILVLLSPICLGETIYAYYPNPLTVTYIARLTGNQWIQDDAQKKRLLQVLGQLHGQTILPGKSYWNFSQSPAVVDFSENRCWVAYTFHEYHCGRGAEADYRSKLNNNFYDGKIGDPLSFLKGNNIAAVMIWPEDAISDQQLKQFQDQLSSEFFYIDCKMGGTNNAGLFIRQSDLEPMPGMVGYSTEN